MKRWPGSGGRHKGAPPPEGRLGEAAIAGVLQEMTARIVERFRPEGVILFGSYARGTAHPHSDVDLLVVLPGETDTVRAQTGIAAAIKDLGVPTDVVVTTREHLQRWGDLVGLVYRPALREGTVLYGAKELKARCPVSEADVHAETRKWLAYAEEDLGMLALALGRTPPYVHSACFHAQQAVEKALKAVLIWLQIDFTYTHNLEGLRALIPEGWAVKDAKEDLEAITTWVVRGRYPDTKEPPPGLPEAESAAETARSVVEGVRRDLAERGLAVAE